MPHLPYIYLPEKKEKPLFPEDDNNGDDNSNMASHGSDSCPQTPAKQRLGHTLRMQFLLFGATLILLCMSAVLLLMATTYCPHDSHSNKSSAAMIVTDGHVGEDYKAMPIGQGEQETIITEAPTKAVSHPKDTSRLIPFPIDEKPSASGNGKVKVGDTAGDGFSKCCRESGMTEACGEGWCTYPPTDPWTPWDIKCWGEHIKEFVKCYTQNKNNQVCCAQNDVVGAYSICQDLCNGEASQYNFNAAYITLCKMRKDAISKCNHDARQLSASTDWLDADD